MRLITLCSWVGNGGGAIKFLGSHRQGVEAAPTAQCVLPMLLDVRGMANGPTCNTVTAMCSSACGGQHAECSGRHAAGGGGQGPCGGQWVAAATTEMAMRRWRQRRQCAVMCGSFPLVVTAMLFDIQYSTLFFLCREHLKR
jgi:hypothetical protein